MNLKPIEMQIALPRTAEAGAVQQQHNHKPMQDQAQAMGQSIKQADDSRKRAAKTEESDQASIRDEQQRSKGQQHGRRDKQAQHTSAEEKGEPDHPYKGRHIDFSL